MDPVLTRIRLAWLVTALGTVLVAAVACSDESSSTECPPPSAYNIRHTWLDDAGVLRSAQWVENDAGERVVEIVSGPMDGIEPVIADNAAAGCITYPVPPQPTN